MRIPKPLLFILAAFVTLGALRPSQAHAQVSISFFYDNLSPYGEWVDDPDYGYCWHPTSADENWTPYTDGYWAYTDGGWTWVSYEDYGGIVYHYGRWTELPGEGWVWVPGYQWAPAWVSWRYSDDYVGWAPLPPEAHWRAGFGFGGWVDSRFDIGPGFYSFVHVGDFGAPALGAVILDRGQNVTIINRTTNITNITVNNSNVYTGGPSYALLAARSTRPIPTLRLVRQGGAAAIAGANGKFLARQQGNQLMVISPHVTAPTGKAPAPANVAKTITGVKAEHGWSIVKDPQERAQLQSKFKTEAGTTLTPAHAVKADDLKIVTEKTKAAPTPKPLVTNEAVKGEGTPKPKKAKTPSDAELENSPAAENLSGEPTPKSKGKTKKSEESISPEDNGAFATPEPQFKKSKKEKTPSEEGAFEPQAEEAPVEKKPKHETGESPELQPFNAGGQSSHSDEFSQGKGGPEATGKDEDKKKKGKGEPTPPQ